MTSGGGGRELQRKMFGEVVARCASCGKVLRRSRTEKPRGTDARGRLRHDYCPADTPCGRARSASP